MRAAVRACALNGAWEIKKDTVISEIAGPKSHIPEAR